MSAKPTLFLLALLSSTLLTQTDSVAIAHGPNVDELPGDSDFADPFVLREGKKYYAFGTGNADAHLQMARSEDLAHWKKLPDALPVLPAWAAPLPGTTWAPSALRRSRQYVLYYTAREARSGFQCISRAVSTTPEGPYVDMSPAPLICDHQMCGAIDPSPFVDDGGRAYLLWKTDENNASCQRPSRLWSQPLADDGLGLVDAPAELLTADRLWERPLIEAPSMVRHADRYFLFYSANWYESADYAVGYATCSRPLGPCTKVTLDNAFLRSSKALLGPGGEEFFHDEAGATWMAFHAWPAPKVSYASGGARALRLARLQFKGDEPTVELVTN